MPTANRPLSPHLQIYKPQLTSALSILHRGTGLVLGVGNAVFILWLLALAGGPLPYGAIQGFLASALGRLLLLGWTFSFFYHFANGIRHLLWDTGRNFDLASTYRTGRIVVAISVGLTVLAYVIGFFHWVFQ